MSNLTYDLRPAQSKIAASPKRFRVICAGRRFGKTWLSGAEIMRHATSKEASSRPEESPYVIWYIAPVNEQAKNIMWNGWLKKFVPKEWIAYTNEQSMMMILKNKAEIHVFSADKPDHLVGTYIDFLIIDECALIDGELYEKIYPSLTDHHGDGMFISTPRGYNWFYDLYNSEKTDDDFESFHFTTMEGGNVSQEEIAKAKRRMSPKMFQQEFCASFETLSNRVYDSFDRELNVTDYFDPTWGLGDIHIGMDFNVNPMTCTFAVIEKDKKLGEVTYFFDEIHEPNSNTFEICRMIRERYPRAEVFVYPDPTGRKRQTSAVVGKTDFTILEQAGFHVCAPYAPYSSRDKFNTANMCFSNAAGERHAYVVKDRCPNLQKGLEGYTYKENGQDTDKSGGLDHITDAMAYYLTYKFPVKAQGRLYRPSVLGV